MIKARDVAVQRLAKIGWLRGAIARHARQGDGRLSRDGRRHDHGAAARPTPFNRLTHVRGEPQNSSDAPGRQDAFRLTEVHLRV